MSATAYVKSKKYLEEENRSFRANSPLRRSKKKVALFVASTLDDRLARPLSPGLQYAAEIASFDELCERNIWELPPEKRSFFTQQQVDSIFRAKCEDQQTSFSFDRAQRFTKLIFEMCQGEWCVLRQCGLGIHALKAICDIFVHDKNITHLDLSGNTFGPAAGEHLARLLTTNSSLVVLRLQSVNIGEGAVPLMAALKANPFLTALDLSGIPGITRNTIWGASAVSVADMLAHNQVLADINLAHCGLQRNASLIAKACQQHVALTRLNLSGNKLKDEGCKAVAQVLCRGTCSLLSLALEENAITCAGAITLGEALKTQDCPAASQLQQLFLGFNSIGAKGLSVLASAIKDHHNMQMVALQKNKLLVMGVDEDGYRLPDNVEGIMALSAAVESSRTLHTLKLTDCGIHTLPWNFPNALMRTRTLQRLEINENPFGTAGGALLAEGIGKNRSLTMLDCTQCNMQDSMGALAQALESHKTLLHLRINQGSWDPHGCGMVDALRQNQVVISVDLGKDALDYLRGSLARNRQLRVNSATPQLAEKQQELAEEESELQRTQEFIVDEIKSREKAVEQLKLLRERQKVSAQQMKDELEVMKTACDEGAKQVARLQSQAQAQEDEYNQKVRECDNEKNRLLKKCETLNTQKVELIAKTTSLVRQYAHLFPQHPLAPPPSGPTAAGVSPANQELQKLDLELRVLQNELKDDKERCEALKGTLEELLKAGGGGPTTAVSTAPSPTKKK